MKHYIIFEDVEASYSFKVISAEILKDYEEKYIM